MNAKKLIFTLCASLLLASGVNAGEAPAQECIKPVDTANKCSGDRHYPFVVINTQMANLDRLFVCAARASTIKFMVVPIGKNDIGTVAIKPIDPNDTWLIGANSPDQKWIKILVPDWVADKSDHGYTILFSDGRCIDPRVHVED